MKKQLKVSLIGNIPIVLICFLLVSSLSVLSNALYDFNMRNSMSQEYHQDIVVVGIDDKSLKENGAWPWDRSKYIPLIENLENAGAKVIAFDVMFNEAGANAESDKKLAETLGKYKNIIFPAQAVFEGGSYDFDNTSTAYHPKNGPIEAKGLTSSLELFGKVTQTAHINADLDKDGVIRNTFLQVKVPNSAAPLPSMAVKAAEIAGVDVTSQLDKYPNKEMAIRYDLLFSDFQTIPFVDVVNKAPKLKDRIVLVGFTANGFENDDGKTPIEKKTKLIYVHANIINQLINDSHIKDAGIGLTRLLIAVMIALALLLTWLLRPTYSVIAVFVLLAIALGGQYWLFASQGLFVNVVNPIAALLLTFLVNISIKTYFETKQKNYITKQFGRYISPELVKEIAASDQEIKLGGTSKELTVLFLDVRGFTPLSEKLSPEEVVGFLNMMFDLITERALANHGTIDKFIGDAAMILYNAPLDVQHHPYYAVKSAFEIQKGMEKVRADVLEKYGVTIAVGIGINTGQVVVGNIGSYLRVDYTAIGDNVNTAARIESNTQPNQVLVSEATYELTKDYFEYNCIGEKMMKGKSVPVKLYEVLGIVKAPA
ncbi:adenylate/guanylate cyclase domain-containing protein [Paenibacillus cymbidii]|uniref:adenylate/guanylate cyclase domain-containing protein n=1 Tax=Paenibacillus cymbidii TaxID=1639034 RepID=UPI001081894B|nr:adenylate/guanylate cyclase domain-containing protein [Paenibacillus cymbidii]